MQDEADTRRIAIIKNSLYGLVSWAFPILPTLITTPILISGFGSEVYGIYVLVLGFTTYFVTYGIGKVAAKFIAEYRATGENEKISEILSATIILTLSIGIVATFFLALFARRIVFDILQIKPEFAESAVTSLYIACPLILIGSLSNIYQNVLQGIHRFDRYMLLMNLGALLLAIGNVAVVLSGYGLVGIFICNVIITVLLTLTAYVWIRSLLPEFHFTFRFGKASWKAVWRYAIGIMGYQLFGNIIFLFERAWLTRRFGSESVTYYAVPMALAMYIHLFTGNLVSALFPVVNELLDDKVRLRNLYDKATKLILAITAFAVTAGLIGGQTFLANWISDDFADRARGILAIHIVTFGILSTVPIVWQIAEGYRRASLNSLVTFIWMVVSIPLMVLFSSFYEAEGIALARLVGVLVFIPMIFLVESRLVGGVSWGFWIKTFARIIPPLSLSGISIWVMLARFKGSWAVLIFAMMIGAIVYITGLCLTGFFTKDERQLLDSIIVRFRVKT